MGLRITSGVWRHRLLSSPSAAITRPISQKARLAVLSILRSHFGAFEGLRGLDLFAGSGSLGLELLSQGAQEVVFVENHPHVLSHLCTNITQLSAQGKTIAQDVSVFLDSPPLFPFDIIYLGPPYRHGLAEPSLQKIDKHSRQWLSSGGLLIAEVERGLNPPDLCNLSLRSSRHFGIAQLWDFEQKTTALKRD